MRCRIRYRGGPCGSDDCRRRVAVAYIRARDRVWFATGEEIVRHWLQIGRDLLTGRALFILLSTGGRELARFASQAIWSLRDASTGG